ncbi:hypothetical protein QFC20_002780 [Naganishia adeliensis]|uniref:Uncharacterized protein n=1 Tax=Naganishia adeliensis TaxID=92952 RepID=A0ACC2WG41_9TREE|nr:hypothetical protein QFC20_002780 [Naganishia adeliensis]
MPLQGSALLALVTCLTGAAFLLIGYDNGVMGGVINGSGFQNTFNNPSPGLLGTIVAIYEIGCCVGSLLTAFIGDRLGRRRTICLGAVVMLAGTGFQAGVSSSGPMIAARIISDLGMGAINSTCPVLMAEVSPKASRGRYVAAQLSMLNLGIFLAYWVGYGFTNYVTGSVQWRIPVALQSVFIIIIIIILCFLVPESPRYDLSHGNQERALETLSLLNARPSTDSIVLEQYLAIEQAVELEKSVGSGSWAEFLRWKDDEIKSKRRLFIACFIQAAQQLGGINGIIYYAGTLLKTTGLDDHNSSLVSGFLFTWFFIASFIPWFLIDRVGRRPLLLVCISLMACTFAAQAGLIWKVETSGSRAAGAAATAVLFVYMGLFTTGFQAVVWVYPSEVLPLAMRAKGSSISTAANWICNLAIVEMTPSAIANIGYKFYIIFAILNALWVPVIYFMFPETAGLALEDVDQLFAEMDTLRISNRHVQINSPYKADLEDNDVGPSDDKV